MKNIKTVLVDNLEFVKITLDKVQSQFPHIEIISVASDFYQAREIINKLQPDLVLLNIDTIALSTIDLMKDLNCSPKIIYINAKENIELKAFELKEVDQLVKPIKVKPVSEVIEKITKPIEDVTERNFHGNDTFQTEQIILLNFDNKMNFIKIKDINFIEAFGNYTKVNMDDGKLSITYNSIKNWQAKLPENNFLQIHRSTIVNLLNVQKIEKWNNDTGRLYLKGLSNPLDVSRSYFFQIRKKYKM
jgi:two-component system, LytTR family, response regulator